MIPIPEYHLDEFDLTHIKEEVSNIYEVLGYKNLLSPKHVKILKSLSRIIEIIERNAE